VYKRQVQILAVGKLVQPVRVTQVAVDDAFLGVAGCRPVEPDDAITARPQASGYRTPDQTARSCHHMHPHAHRQLASLCEKSAAAPKRDRRWSSMSYGRSGMAMGRIGEPVAPRNRMQAPKKANS